MFYSNSFTGNDSNGMSNTVAIVAGLVVFFLILLALAIGVGCFFYRRRKKRPLASGTLHTLRTCPSTRPNPIGAESSTVARSASPGYKREPSTPHQPTMQPHYANFPNKVDVERKDDTTDIPPVISSRDYSAQVGGERHYEEFTPTPLPRKEKGDSNKSGGENNKAAEVTPPAISSWENGKQYINEGVTLFRVSDIGDDD